MEVKEIMDIVEKKRAAQASQLKSNAAMADVQESEEIDKRG